ncbi:MAG TPA: DUF1934 domain-containing protein [Clostridiales bacterium]|nr:DUF1934 domain-containing protein [Clostridiales bacterium]
MKDVIIKIKGTQILEDHKEVIEFTTLGKLGHKDGKFYLTYKENDSFGTEDVTTTVKIESDKLVTMQRTGAIESRLTIENGKRHMCHYVTMQGEIMIGIFGETIKNDLNENGGQLFMSYTIDVNYGMLSRNEVEIKVSEVKKDVDSFH